jgi:hypothetical protein
MSLIVNTVRFGSGFFHEETRETKSGSDRDGGEEATMGKKPCAS